MTLRTLSVLLVPVLFAVAACGATGSDTSGDSGGTGGGVTVDHRFGATTVESEPKRVVTLDAQWTDTFIAMGVEPVGYAEDALMPDSGPPWWDEERTGKALSIEDGVPVERIAALQPDLIVGTYTIADRQIYEQLTGIAPTIAGGPAADQVQTWQELVGLAGELLQQPERAEKLTASVEADVEEVADRYAGLGGQTFVLAQYIVGDDMYVVTDEDDGSSRLFQQLGMRLFPTALKEGEDAGQTRLQVGTERADLLEADFLVFLVNGGDERDLQDIPGFERLPAVRSGAAAVLDYATVVGINTPTPLSIPYALEKLDPYLAKAAA